MENSLEMKTDVEYDRFLALLQDRFDTLTESGKQPLFTTDVENLFGIYHAHIPEDQRQFHNCHCCRHFMNRYGSLVTIDEYGQTHSALWPVLGDVPSELFDAVLVVRKVSMQTKVTGVFVSSENVYGNPVTGQWKHLSLVPPKCMIHNSVVKTAFQASAEKSEDFKTVMTALSEFTVPMLDQALKLLRSDSLYRSEKVLGQAEWLHWLLVKREKIKGKSLTNVIWKAVATAPAGFCHPRSSMIGTLLEDIRSGMSFEQISYRFAAKMHPLQYLRPQAAPSSGAIAAAEKIFEQLKAAGSLARRFVRLDEVVSFWRPQADKQSDSAKGLFGHLKTKDAKGEVADIAMPPIVMTWDKFSRTVVPTAEQIELYAEPTRRAWSALVTSVNADAPPIIQWDMEDNRNPVTWYVWHGGSLPIDFSIISGRFHKIDAICHNPSKWGGMDFSHHSDSVLLIVEGARETNMAGAALFPELMKSEFHGIRSVIESYSRKAEIQGLKEPHVAGLSLGKGSCDALLRVTVSGLKTQYKIDRWE